MKLVLLIALLALSGCGSPCWNADTNHECSVFWSTA